jgi:two-component system chemotaxis response regulator CheB
VTRLLIVDDSALVRKLLSDLFAREGDVEVEVARNGREALELLSSFKPDVVTLDIHMPDMDGLACLDRIMVERPTPVVMVSSLTAEGAEETFRALALGAVDFIEKPSGALSMRMDELGPVLVRTVRQAAKARIRTSHRLAERVRAGRSAVAPAPRAASRVAPTPATLGDASAFGLLLVGASTGGPPALDMVLGTLPAQFPWPVLVAQHMPKTFTGPLARRLDSLCALEVVEVTRPTPVRRGTVYVGRGDADLIVSQRADGLVALAAPSSAEFVWHPSVDRLVDSAMALLPARQLAGVLMTGMGYDGAAAMTRLRQAGGLTLAEAEETAVVWGMPGELVRMGGASAVLPLEALGPAVVKALAVK